MPCNFVFFAALGVISARFLGKAKTSLFEFQGRASGDSAGVEPASAPLDCVGYRGSLGEGGGETLVGNSSR